MVDNKLIWNIEEYDKFQKINKLSVKFFSLFINLIVILYLYYPLEQIFDQLLQ